VLESRIMTVSRAFPLCGQLSKSESPYTNRLLGSTKTTCLILIFDFLWLAHRVERVPGFLTSHSNWVHLPPHRQASVAPLFGSGRGHTRLRERGWADSIRTRGQTPWYL
jgi:hypothetical protein